MGTFRACLGGGGEGGGGGGGGGDVEGVGKERERGMFFYEIWLSQRLGHCCVYYGTVLRTLILPSLAPCHFHRSKTAPKCHTTRHRSIE